MGLRVLSALGALARLSRANVFTANQRVTNPTADPEEMVDGAAGQFPGFTFYRAGVFKYGWYLHSNDTLRVQDDTGSDFLILSRGTGRTRVQRGIEGDGSGFKHARVTTGGIGGASTALVTVTWGTAFADANYSVVASVEDSTATSLSLSVVHVETKTAAAVAVRVLNNAAGALTGTLDVIAVHD